MMWTNGILKFLHIIGQHQQYGARAVEGEVKDGRVNCLVIIDIKSLLLIHHLDRNLDNDNFNMKSLDWKTNMNISQRCRICQLPWCFHPR